MRPSLKAGCFAAVAVMTMGTIMPAPATSIAFVVLLVGTDEAREPTLSYAPNGTIWYSGMNHPITPNGWEANLWFAHNDTQAFVRETDPPTSGGIDAVVHHDSAGRLFFAEQSSGVQVTVRDNGAWSHVTIFPNGDRPWFRTNSSGLTFLAFKNTTTTAIETWTNSSNAVGWSMFSSDAASPAGLADFWIHSNDTIAVLFLDETDDDWRVSLRGKLDSHWSETSGIDHTHLGTYGPARIAFDSSGNMYVIYGETVGNDHSIWLRRYVASSNTWTSAFRVSDVNHTAALASIAAGSTGRVGIAWYDVEGNYEPGEVPLTSYWSFRYALMESADSSPSIVQSVEVQPRAHQGPRGAGGTGVGDCSYILPRQWDSTGKVVLAFACDRTDPIEGCIISLPAHWPVPVFARQTAGPGLF